MIAKKTYPGLIKWIIPILIISWFISAAGAFELSKLQWDNGTSGTLKRNEEISFNGYTVKVVVFSAPAESQKYKQVPIEPVVPFVGLNITKDGNFLNTTTLGPGESYISPDVEFMVTAVGLPSGTSKDWLYESYNPSAKLQLSQRGKPHLEVSIDTDDEYVSASNTEINVKVNLRNTGTADITNVNVDLGTNFPLLRGYLHYNYETIKKGGAVSEEIIFSSPIVTELKKYLLFVNATGIDVKDLSYNATQLKTILIAPQTQQAPTLKKSTIAKMYLKDQMMVTLSLKNNANYELKNVSIVDAIPKGFKQLSNNSLHWVVNVPPNSDWYSRYLMKPTEANSKGVIFPSATAELKINNEYYMIQSNRPETLVYGPRIDLTKQSEVQEIGSGEAVTITLVAVNSGSTPTMVTIRDTLPSDVTLVSGTTSGEEYLEANKDIRISYTIRSDSDGPINLPPASGEYFELGSRGTKINMTSNELLISIRPPPPIIPPPEPTVEIPVNYSEEGYIGEVVEPGIEIPQMPEQYLIPPPVTEPLLVEGNAVLDLLLGCSNNIGIESRSNTTSEVCSIVANNP